MADDINDIVLEKIKNQKLFSLQIDESIDKTSKAQLLGFGRFVDNFNIVEQFLFCKELMSTTTGEDIFDVVNNFFEKSGLSWNYCCGVCTDGAPSMTGKYKGFVTLAKIKNPAMIITHCFIHREALVAKTLREKMLKVLNEMLLKL